MLGKKIGQVQLILTQPEFFRRPVNNGSEVNGSLGIYVARLVTYHFFISE